MSVKGSNPPRTTAFQDMLRAAQPGYVWAAIFSIFLNILLLASPIYMMQIFDRVLTSGHQSTLAYLSIIVLMALIVLGLLDAMRSWLLARSSNWVFEQAAPVIRRKTVRATLNGAPRSAQPLRDLAQVQNFFSGYGVLPLFDAPWAPIFIIVIGMVHPALGGFALISAAILFALGVANEKVTRAPSEAGARRQLSGLNAFDTALRNAEILEAHGMEAALGAHWRRNDRETVAQLEQAAERSAMIAGLSKFFRMAAQVGVLGFGALFAITGEISPGGMIAASILLGRALAPMEQLISAWRLCVGARSAYMRIQALFRGVPDEPERVSLPPPRGDISFEDAVFRARADKPPILRGVSFALDAGEVLGVVGPSAAGKTTLCRLLTGVYPPTSGHVRLDGAEISAWRRDELGGYIGYLPQDVELFPGTVAENIARMAEPDSDRVIAAARCADVHDLILGLSDGYETRIGERGEGLSAGQQQRIALARTVYNNPRLIILDEPNSNLDQAGEEALQRAIAQMKAAGSTVVLVAHRPSALQHADKVLVLCAGAVQSFGPKDEVLGKLAEEARKRATTAPPIDSASANPSTGKSVLEGRNGVGVTGESV